jgi:hypothetical protein
LGVNPGKLKRVDPGVPAESGFLQLADDFLAGLILGAAFAKLNGHLAILPALEKADTGQVVPGDAERIRGGNPLPFPDALRKAGLAVVCGCLNVCGGGRGLDGDGYGVGGGFFIGRFAFT